MDYNYSYEIVATVKGLFAESEGKSVEVWSKSYPIVPSEAKSDSGSNFGINKTVTIDYKKYNDIMTDFRNQFGLSVDARVDLAFKINVTGGTKEAPSTLQESNIMTLQVPLLKPTIEIKPDYINNGGDIVYKNTNINSTSTLNIPLLLIGIALLLLSLIMMKKLVGQLLNTTRKSEYVLKLNKILKEYGDIIAIAENMPNLAQYDVVNLKDFNDIVDIEEELHSPIIYNEIREDLESWFIITNDKTAYKYVLRYENFDHFKR